jgi:hypothetical protein
MTTSCIVDPGDMAIIQGNNYPPIIWQFLVSENPDVLFDLTGSTFKLRVIWPGGTLDKATGTDPELTIDFTNSKLTWNYTTTESRLFPLGRIAQYELERWITGSQQSLIRAGVAVLPGSNPDV